VKLFSNDILRLALNADEEALFATILSTLLEGGMGEEEAIENALRKCAPEKYRSFGAISATTPRELAVDIWINGTREQREGYGNGTEQRTRDEKAPDAWLEDAVANIGRNEAEEFAFRVLRAKDASRNAYRVTVNQKPSGGVTYNAHDVPIFAEHIPPEAPNVRLTENWLRSGVGNAMDAWYERGYTAPLTVNHHDFMVSGAERRGAGSVMPIFVDREIYQGQPTAIMYATLLNIKPDVFAAMQDGLIPHRSVEIPYDLTPAKINALSLLDKDQPFFEFANMSRLEIDPEDIELASRSERPEVLCYFERDQKITERLFLWPHDANRFQIESEEPMENLTDHERKLVETGDFDAVRKDDDEKEMKRAEEEEEATYVEGEEEEAERQDEGGSDIVGMLRQAAELIAAAAEELGTEEAEEEEAEELPAAVSPVELSSDEEEAEREEDEEDAERSARTDGQVEALAKRVNELEREREIERSVRDEAAKLTRFGWDLDEATRKLAQRAKKSGVKAMRQYSEGLQEAGTKDPEYTWSGDLEKTAKLAPVLKPYAAMGADVLEAAMDIHEDYLNYSRRGNTNITADEFIRTNLVDEGVVEANELPEKGEK
jgi:hypothetical protein